MSTETTYRSPFNYVQVLIAALGVAYLNVIAYFIGESFGASMEFSGGLIEHVQFAHVIGWTIAPIMVLGLVVFVLGRGKPGLCKVAGWAGLVVAALSIASPIVFATDIATSVTMGVLHLVAGVAFLFAVHHSNKN
ncbi:DUF6069 family protein [Glutamicibacter sp. MNS18]|uniref:DUF6069 family protein n=1 Tax=Glutamicibacter sp. MNS18 TaxID=2989817 RepID=UPI002235D6F4|nr:DUF6069 family protein [Glutamicibacter sp. MNS18]MCW4467256.1 DUF6069 family protein [Glutamicibacter sp. MNS18]